MVKKAEKPIVGETGYISLEAVGRIHRDVAKSAEGLEASSARFMMGSYFNMQENRMRLDNQIRAMGKINQPTDVMEWLRDQNFVLEESLKKAVTKYVKGDPIGKWMLEQKGVGPLTAAPFLCYLDIHKAPTAGHFMAYCGLDPTKKWEKGQKRPWNPTMKKTCWLLGEAFVKSKNRENAVYGQLYQQRKDLETAKNQAGDYKEQADHILATRNFKPGTDVLKEYQAGRLAKAHIHERAKRWAVKIFLSHLHEKWYQHEFGKPAPSPYPLAHLGHAHKIDPPE
jgi:hypothetical protein